MTTSTRVPKQWPLTTSETLNSFRTWKETLCYALSQDAAFKPYLKEGVTWGKQTSATPHRGYTDDTTTVTNAKTKEQKVEDLNLMLGQIANFTTVISRNQIIDHSTSLDDVWNKLMGLI